MEAAQQDIEALREVGIASYEALLEAKRAVVAGARLIDVAERVEGSMRAIGFAPAFPLNLSLNHEAAHYTPSLGDQRSFAPGDVVKIDVGVGRSGVLGDCAATVDLSGKHGALVEAADDALRAAIGAAREGVAVCALGGIIARAIEAKGFKPIRNLGGHGVESHAIHAGVFIPNIDNGDTTELRAGMTIAIEPFATDGAGTVRESDACEIFEFAYEAPVRSRDARLALSTIKEEYGSEPFAARWLSGTLGSRFRVYAALAELVRSGALRRHPVLVESGKGVVAQAEAMVLIQKEGCEVLTRARA